MSSHSSSTIFQFTAIYSLLLYSLFLSTKFSSYFIIFNKTRLRDKERDQFIESINQSLEYLLDTVFLFTDKSATI